MNPPITLFATFLRVLPDALHAEMASRISSHLLRGQSLGEQLAELDGKHICLAVEDTGNRFNFIIRHGRLMRAAGESFDVRISATFGDFLLLARRREDPDTLFFQRRLKLEGDTDTGLHLKNLLDAFEYDLEAHLIDVLGPGPAAIAQAGLSRLQPLVQRKTRPARRLHLR